MEPVPCSLRGKMMNETEFKNWMRKRYGGWSESYEPSYGSGVGMPDIQFLMPDRNIFPVEAKLGFLGAGNCLRIRHVRASQVRWHAEFSMALGRAAIAVCFENDNGFALFPGSKLIGWKKGIHARDIQIHEGKLDRYFDFKRVLDEYYRDMKKGIIE